MKNRVIAYILIAVMLLYMVLTIIPPVFAQENTVTISSAEDFIKLSEKCALDTWSRGKTVNLTCDIDFEDGDERIFDPDDEPLDECSLDELLNKLSGILDMAYEYTDDSDERSYICKVEDALWDNLRKAGLIK